MHVMSKIIWKLYENTLQTCDNYFELINLLIIINLSYAMLSFYKQVALTNIRQQVIIKHDNRYSWSYVVAKVGQILLLLVRSESLCSLPTVFHPRRNFYTVIIAIREARTASLFSSRRVDVWRGLEQSNAISNNYNSSSPYKIVFNLCRKSLSFFRYSLLQIFKYIEFCY